MAAHSKREMPCRMIVKLPFIQTRGFSLKQIRKNLKKSEKFRKNPKKIEKSEKIKKIRKNPKKPKKSEKIRKTQKI